MLARYLDKGTIRRPSPEDLTEDPAIEALRETGEFVGDTAGEVASAGMKLTRVLLVAFLLPMLALPSLIAMGPSAAPGWLKLLWQYAAVITLALLAWTWGFKAEWRARQAKRRERLDGLEDTAQLRISALGGDHEIPSSG